MKRIVGFSGGIDSQRAALWVRQNYPADEIVLLNSNVGGHEHAITVQFIADYSAKIFPVTVVSPIYADMWLTPKFAEKRGFDSNAPLSFLDMIKIKGRPPSRKAQFCTEHMKLRPCLRWLRERYGVQIHDPSKPTDVDKNVWAWKEEIIRYTGLRRDESNPRADTPDWEWDDWFECRLEHPIAAMTKQQCFDDVLAAGEFTNPLYALGFNRVGCAPCINEGRLSIRNWAKRFPDVIDRVRMYERESGRTFFAPMVPGKHTNNIDEVIEWANCSRGGKQYALDVYMPAPVCESKFGLCE